MPPGNRWPRSRRIPRNSPLPQPPPSPPPPQPPNPSRSPPPGTRRSSPCDLAQAGDDGGRPGGFTVAQIRALDSIYGGVKPNGAELVPGWPVGAEIAAPTPNGGSASGWLPWFVAPPAAR